MASRITIRFCGRHSCMNIHLTDFEKDQLREVASISAGNASTALSQLIGRDIGLTVPHMAIDRVEHVEVLMGDASTLSTVVVAKILGDVFGAMLVIFPPADAHELSELLIHHTTGHETAHTQSMEGSAIREIGNIVAGAYLNAFSQFLNLNAVQSVTETMTDQLGAIVDAVFIGMGQKHDQVFVFSVNFSVKGEDVKGRLFLVFDPGSTERILAITRGKLGASTILR